MTASSRRSFLRLSALAVAGAAGGCLGRVRRLDESVEREFTVSARSAATRTLSLERGQAVNVSVSEGNGVTQYGVFDPRSGQEVVLADRDADLTAPLNDDPSVTPMEAEDVTLHTGAPRTAEYALVVVNADASLSGSASGPVDVRVETVGGKNSYPTGAVLQSDSVRTELDHLLDLLSRSEVSGLDPADVPLTPNTELSAELATYVWHRRLLFGPGLNELTPLLAYLERKNERLSNGLPPAEFERRRRRVLDVALSQLATYLVRDRIRGTFEEAESALAQAYAEALVATVRDAPPDLVPFFQTRIERRLGDTSPTVSTLDTTVERRSETGYRVRFVGRATVSKQFDFDDQDTDFQDSEIDRALERLDAPTKYAADASIPVRATLDVSTERIQLSYSIQRVALQTAGISATVEPIQS